MSNSWVQHTKDYSSKNGTSYKESLSSYTNRASYYDTQIDRSKFNRGPHLLQPDHPAMHPYIPNSTPEQRKITQEIHIQTKRSMAGKPVQFKK